MRQQSRPGGEDERASLAAGCLLPLDLQGALVRQRPIPCLLGRRLNPTGQQLRITNAETGAVVYDDEIGGWQQ